VWVVGEEVGGVVWVVAGLRELVATGEGRRANQQARQKEGHPHKPGSPRA
jgi:hypothetical protein